MRTEAVTSAPRDGTHHAEGAYEQGRLALQEQMDRSDVLYFCA